MGQIELFDCSHCNTSRVLPMSDGRCPNCKKPLNPKKSGGDARLSCEADGQPESDDMVENSIGMKLAWIPPGEFLMGSPNDFPFLRDYPNELPQHRVEISKGFFMGTTPVTQGQYKAVIDSNPSRFKGNDLPVDSVSWDDAVEFCSKLSEKEGKTYRLPTEAQWEYGCRAGTTERFYFADDSADLSYYAWYYRNSNNTTHPVSQKKPNAFGLYDMHGNVSEWCADWYDEHFYSKSPESDPRGPKSGKYRVLRGGSWCIFPRFCRSAFRGGNTPSHRAIVYGFRVVLDLK